MSIGRKATSKQSTSVHEGTGYNEIYLSGHEPMEDFTWSPKREPSTHSPTEEEEYIGDEGDGEEGEEEEEEGDKEEREEEGE